MTHVPRKVGTRTNSEQGFASRVSLANTTKTSSFDGGRFTTPNETFHVENNLRAQLPVLPQLHRRVGLGLPGPQGGRLDRRSFAERERQTTGQANPRLRSAHRGTMAR